MVARQDGQMRREKQANFWAVLLIQIWLFLSIISNISACSLSILLSDSLPIQSYFGLYQFFCRISYLHYRTRMQLQQSRPISDKYAVVDSQLLGKGSTGNVYLGFLLAAPQVKVAVKAISLREIDNQVTRYLLSCEIAALSNLGKAENSAHENVVRLLDVVIQESYIYLVTELLEGGTLSQYMKRTPNGMSEEEAVLIFRQILQGYRQIRSKGIVHRDLKPDNLLFKTRPEVSRRIVVIDFGYCQMAEVPNKPQMFYNVGSPKYMAPQAYVDNLYSEKSDMWALGVIFYEMLVGRTCDQGLKMEAYLEMIRRSGIPLPGNLSPFAKQILTKMLAYSHQARSDCLQILKDFENHQAGCQGHIPQAQFRSSQFNESANEFYGLRANKNNQVFKSALLGPVSHPPPQLLQSMMQLNILIHEPPTNIPQEQRSEINNLDKKFVKSNSSKNVQTPISFNAASGPILGRVENADVRQAHSGKRIVEVKSCRPIQTSNVQPLDVSFPSHKVRFNLVPSHPSHGHGQHIHVHNLSTRDVHPHHQPQREQRFMSNSQADENAIKISIKPAFQRFTAVPKQTVMSIEKVGDNRMFHSPVRRVQGAKVQFFTEKKVQEKEEGYHTRHMNVRPFNGEIRRGLQGAPMSGLVPLFH